jgi:hypothetical protein
MITGESGSSFRKAYLRPEGKDLSLIGGLGGPSNSLRGSRSVGPSSSSTSLVKNWSSSSKFGSINSSRNATLTSSIGPGLESGSKRMIYGHIELKSFSKSNI